MIKKQLEIQLKNALTHLSYPVPEELKFEIPANTAHGHFATNLAFLLAKELRKAPKLIAEEASRKLGELSEFSGKITFTPLNGFINLTLTDDYLWQLFSTLTQKSPEFPADHPLKKAKILLEYVSANPTGPLHIGHGRWAVVGSTLYNLLKYAGFNITSEFYINDTGNQIEKFYESVEAARQGKPIPEDGYKGEYILELARKKEDPLQVNIDHQRFILEKVGAHFDNWISEKKIHESGNVSAVLAELKQKGAAYENDGALWFKATEYGDEKDRVLIKNDGKTTYFAADLAYHKDKINRCYDMLINIWGTDHHGYIQRVKSGLSALCGAHYLSDAHFRILLGQLVSLKRGDQPVRMSKRAGEMVTFEEVVEEIGTDATRYFLVEKSMDTHLDFDLDLAKKQSSENPVFYIQYAHARICSILEKAAEDPVITPTVKTTEFEEKERQLLLYCLRFHEEIWEAAIHFTPHRVANYVLELARSYHHFYEECPVLKSEETVKNRRIAILKTVKEIIGKCLHILGVSAPTQM